MLIMKCQKRLQKKLPKVKVKPGSPVPVDISTTSEHIYDKIHALLTPLALHPDFFNPTHLNLSFSLMYY